MAGKISAPGQSVQSITYLFSQHREEMMQGNGVKHGSGKRAERMDSVSSRCRCAILQKLQTATGIRQVLVPGLLLGLSLLIPALAGAEERLPLTISSHGKSYTIAAFTLGTNEKGSTTITISGSGFNTMPLLIGVVGRQVVLVHHRRRGIRVGTGPGWRRFPHLCLRHCKKA